MKLITYCGLYCGLCAERSRIPRFAQELRKAMAKEGYTHFGRELDGFSEFWGFLTHLCNPNNCCPGCKQGGGPPFCGIRKCAASRNVEFCPFCKLFPCRRVLKLAEGYPTFIRDARRMREVGVEEWLKEQKQRVETGFVYADIRYPYEVPES